MIRVYAIVHYNTEEIQSLHYSEAAAKKEFRRWDEEFYIIVMLSGEIV
jgi:hypothetical protein